MYDFALCVFKVGGCPILQWLGSHVYVEIFVSKYHKKFDSLYCMICEEAYERKKGKYTELVDLCRQRGWRTWLFPVELGVRRFCSQPICQLMTAVGTTGRERRKAIQKLSQAAERASSWLWLRREEKSWKHQPTHWLITTVGPSAERVFMD